jgi:hypothetical protein
MVQNVTIFGRPAHLDQEASRAGWMDVAVTHIRKLAIESVWLTIGHSAVSSSSAAMTI